MAQQDRKYSVDMSVFTVDGVSQLGFFKNVTLRMSSDLMQARAVKDAWRFRVIKERNWSLDFSKVVENEDSSLSLIQRYGNSVTVVLTSATSGGFSASGTALLHEITAGFPDDAQEQSPMLEGQGVLTITFD